MAMIAKAEDEFEGDISYRRESLDMAQTGLQQAIRLSKLHLPTGM
jgi:hypothetical protein